MARSTARILYEVEARFGRIADAPQIAVALYACYILDDGDPSDEAAFQSYVDTVEDLDAVSERIKGIITDPTPGETITATPSSGSPSKSRGSGG